MFLLDQSRLDAKSAGSMLQGGDLRDSTCLWTYTLLLFETLHSSQSNSPSETVCFPFNLSISREDFVYVLTAEQPSQQLHSRRILPIGPSSLHGHRSISRENSEPIHPHTHISGACLRPTSAQLLEGFKAVETFIMSGNAKVSSGTVHIILTQAPSRLETCDECHKQKLSFTALILMY